MEKILMYSAQAVYLHGKFNEHQEMTRVACTDDTLLIPTFIFTPYYDKILETMNTNNLSILQAAYPVKYVDPALRFLLGFQEYLPKKTQRQLRKWGIILVIKNGKIVAECNQPNEESSSQCGERKLYNSCAINTSSGKRYIEAATKYGLESLPQDYHFMCCIGSIVLNESTIEEASTNYGIPLGKIKASIDGINVTRSIKNSQNTEDTKGNNAQETKTGGSKDESDSDNTETKVKKRKFVRNYRDKGRNKRIKFQHGDESVVSPEYKQKTATSLCNDSEIVNEYKVVTSPVSEIEPPQDHLTSRIQGPPEMDQAASQAPYDGSQCIQYNLSSFPIDVSYDYFDNIDNAPPHNELSGTDVFMGANDQESHASTSGEPHRMTNQSVPKMEYGVGSELQSINTPPSGYDECMGGLWEELADVLSNPDYINSLDWMKHEPSYAANPQY